MRRMGAFTSIPKVAGSDTQDDDLEFPKITVQELLKRCKLQLGDLPRPFERKIRWGPGKNNYQNFLLIKQLLLGQFDSTDTFRIFQWNQLSQSEYLNWQYKTIIADSSIRNKEGQICAVQSCRS